MNLQNVPFKRPVILIFGALAMTACGPSGPQDSGYMAGVGRTDRTLTSGGSNHPAPAIPDDVSYWDGDGAAVR